MNCQLKSNHSILDIRMTKRQIQIICTIVFSLCPLITLAHVKQAAAGIYNSLIVMSDGTLWACGLNDYGQLGDGTTSRRTTPIKVMDSVAVVAAGNKHSLIVKTDGTLWACGQNDYGQLGDGTTNNRTKPVYVTDGVAAVAAGSGHSLIVKTDGTLWTCGKNDYGQLGVGTTNNRTKPVYVTDGVAAVAAGSYHSLILKTDGTLWTCGYNSGGELGDGTTNNKTKPVPVTDGVVAVAAGFFHSLIVKTDGTLWTCGGNAPGQLGNGTTNSSSEFVYVTDGVAAMTAGYYHSLIVKTDGTLWGCGGNNHGQLATEGTVSEKVVNISQSNFPIIEYNYNGVDYLLYLNQTIKINTITANHVDLVIPDSIEYNGTSYAVTDIGDKIFDNGIDNYYLFSASFPSTITTVSEKAFDVFGPTAIIWKSNTALPSTAFSNKEYSNENFLLYVNSKNIAPSNVKNVIVNGEAGDITLAEEYVFNCPQAFTAKSISYTHNYKMETGINECAGWETIALPFTVQTITHESKGNLVPFAKFSQSSGQKPFWLYQLSDKGFVRASTIEANTPYLISMPNNSKYTDSYCLKGKVTFSANNAKVEATDDKNLHTVTYNGSTFYPCFSFYEEWESYYAINVTNDFYTYSGTEAPGSTFINNYRYVYPFEGMFINKTSNSRTLPIVFTDEETLGVEEILADRKSQNIYNIKGQMVGTVKETGTRNALKQLPKGVYIINGRKVAKIN